MRIALCFQYDGSCFCGWQRQKNCLSVQETLEKAILELTFNESKIRTYAAGRTDSGVHAAGQVAHFDYSGPIPYEKWANALNGRLPNEVRIIESIRQPNSWHACHSAIYRRYRYTILNSCRPNLFLEPWSWHRYKFRLDDELMNQALNQLIGTNDFFAFQRAGTNRSNSITTIQAVQLERRGDIIIIEIQAKGFLYGMVRLLVGQLVSIGEHRLSLKDFESRWRNKLRTEVREAAPAKGLCFLRAGYEKTIFSKQASFDTFPSHFLAIADPPKEP